MARTEHYKKSQLRKIVNEHDRRQSQYKNNVDLSRSGLNYNYGVSDADECMQAVNRRVNEIMDGQYLQTQASVAVEWVVTLPKGLAGRDREFFDETWKFCSERYGEKNMIAGYVHMDEDSPHMHLLFVPEVTSRKTGRKTVSSASLMTKRECARFHDDFDKHCERVFGQSRLIRNGKTIGDKMKVSDLKEMEKVLEDRYKAEIASYRDFLTSMHMKDGRSLLEVYEAKQRASAMPKPVPQTLKPDKPAETPAVSHKHAGKVKVENTSKVQESASPKTANNYVTDYEALRRQAQRAMQAREMADSVQNEDSDIDYTK